jgi:hypothetical protein
MRCPLCGESATELHVEIERVTIDLITRDHPDWRQADGSCPRCLEYYRGLVRAGMGAIG